MLSPLTALVIVLAALTQLLAADNSARCRRLLDSGDVAYSAFDNRGALASFTLAYIHCPGSYGAVMKLSRAWIDMGTDVGLREAEDCYERGARYADSLRRLFPDSAQSYFLAAVAAANLSRTRKGMHRIASARRIEPNALKAIEIDPAFAPAWVMLGTYYRIVSQTAAPVKALVRVVYGWSPKAKLSDSRTAQHKALEISPANIYAHLELARTELAMGNRTEAARLLDRMKTLPDVWYSDGALRREGALLRKQLKTP